MKNSKPKRSAWKLRERDLPSERILVREPRLRGLENNPVFRLIIWHRRLHPFKQYFPSTNGGWLALIFLLIYTAGSIFHSPGKGPNLWAHLAFWGYLLARSRPRWFKTKSAARHASSILMGLPDIYIDGLHAAGFPREEILFGLWGSCVRDPRRPETYVLWGTGIVAAMGLCLRFNLTGILRVLALLPIILGTRSLVIRRHEPELAILRAKGLLLKDRSDLLAARHVAAGCVVGLIIFGIAISLISGLGRSTLLLLSEEAGVTLWIEMIIALLVGLFWGTWYGGMIVAKRDRNLADLDRIIRAILAEIAADMERSAEVRPPD
ncbi:hypothetical protein HY256_03220 [Candidatus Sumerlaeota bacterium]|nr:hypothetical protein [Candidatus Sumerlaeota bacterium]